MPPLCTISLLTCRQTGRRGQSTPSHILRQLTHFPMLKGRGGAIEASAAHEDEGLPNPCFPAFENSLLLSYTILQPLVFSGALMHLLLLDLADLYASIGADLGQVARRRYQAFDST